MSAFSASCSPRSPTLDATGIVAEMMRRCRENPIAFSNVVLGRPPLTLDQERICDAVVRHKAVVIPTGNSVGKSYVLAGLILWWLYTRPGSLVIATAPSQTLLGSVLCKEVRRALLSSKIHLPGKMTDSPRASPQTLEIDSAGWQLLAFSTRGVERLSGQHNPDLLVVVDEASGIEEEIWEALDSQNPARLVVCGNPLRAEGRFRELHDRALREQDDETIPANERVHEICIPSTQSPDIHLDRSPRGLADKGFLDESRRQYGEKSLWWTTHVEARFPDVSADALIPEPWLDLATSWVRDMSPPTLAIWKSSRRLACDLGEGVGRDHTCVLVRDDAGVLDVFSSAVAGLPEAANRMKSLARAWEVPDHRCSYDALGLGRDLSHHLIRENLRAVPYKGSGKPKQSAGFTNLRSEAAWSMRRAFDPDYNPNPDRLSRRSKTFHIPPGAWWPRLREDLKTLSYDFVLKRTRLLAKEDWCDRLGRSPDVGDALLQSFSPLI
jgi:hypothetical protein